MACLSFTSPDGEEHELPLAPDMVSTCIGRSPDCDLCINELSISRHHALIEYQDGRYSVRDLDDREVAAFAVRFLDPSTSDLTDAGTATELAERPAGQAPGAVREGDFERRLLALLLCALVVADWWVLGRGRS